MKKLYPINADRMSANLDCPSWREQIHRPSNVHLSIMHDPSYMPDYKVLNNCFEFVGCQAFTSLQLSARTLVGASHFSADGQVFMHCLASPFDDTSEISWIVVICIFFNLFLLYAVLHPHTYHVSRLVDNHNQQHDQ